MICTNQAHVIRIYTFCQCILSPYTRLTHYHIPIHQTYSLPYPHTPDLLTTISPYTRLTHYHIPIHQTYSLPFQIEFSSGDFRACAQIWFGQYWILSATVTVQMAQESRSLRCVRMKTHKMNDKHPRKQWLSCKDCGFLPLTSLTGVVSCGHTVADAACETLMN